MTGTPRLPSLLARFRRDRRGISAVEFGLILPLLAVIMVGIVFVGEALTISRKVDQIGSTISDLIGQRNSLTSAEFTQLMNATATIMQPYSRSPLQVTVSVYTVASNTATVSWSKAYNTTAQNAGDSPLSTIPTSVLENGVQIIQVKVVYNYDSGFLPAYLSSTFGRTGMNFVRYYLAHPRVSDTITLSS